MSWQDDAMAEDEIREYWWNSGEAVMREMYKDDITYRYANPEVTKAFEILDELHILGGEE